MNLIYTHSHDSHVPANIDDSPSKRFYLDHGSTIPAGECPLIGRSTRHQSNPAKKRHLILRPDDGANLDDKVIAGQKHHVGVLTVDGDTALDLEEVCVVRLV